MTGTTLVHGSLRGPDPWRQGAPSDPGSWAGGPRRVFERGDVVAIGKLRRYGDFVTRFVVRLSAGVEVQVTGSEQPDGDRKWLTKLGGNVPCELPTREVPWTLTWYGLLGGI